jgi:hypothetical protein
LQLTADFILRDGLVTFTGAIALIGEISLAGLVSATGAIVGSLTYREADETIVLRGTIEYEVDSILGSDSGSVAIGTHTFPVGNGGAGAGLRSAADPHMHGFAAALTPGAASTSAPSNPFLAAPPPAAPPSSFANLYSQTQWTDYCNAFA